MVIATFKWPLYYNMASVSDETSGWPYTHLLSTISVCNQVGRAHVESLVCLLVWQPVASGDRLHPQCCLCTAIHHALDSCQRQETGSHNSNTKRIFILWQQLLFSSWVVNEWDQLVVSVATPPTSTSISECDVLWAAGTRRRHVMIICTVCAFFVEFVSLPLRIICSNCFASDAEVRYYTVACSF